MKCENLLTEEQVREISRSFVEKIKDYKLAVWQAKEVFRFAIDEMEKQIFK